MDEFSKDYSKTYNIDSSRFRVFAFKETANNIQAIQWVRNVLHNVSPANKIRVLWMVRDVRHVYLSRVEGARKWWGNPGAKPNRSGYENWIRQAFLGVKEIITICSLYETYVLSYEKFAAHSREIIPQLMDSLNLSDEKEQYDYHLHLKKHKPMGDPNVAKNPQRPTREFIDKRKDEWEEFSLLLGSLPKKIQAKEQALLQLCTTVYANGFARYTDLNLDFL